VGKEALRCLVIRTSGDHLVLCESVYTASRAKKQLLRQKKKTKKKQ
jgi:hypothetical protein